MAKTPEVSGLGQHGERVDGPNARDRAQQAIVRMVAEKLDRAILNGVAALDQAAPLRQNEAEHPDRV